MSRLQSRLGRLEAEVDTPADVWVVTEDPAGEAPPLAHHNRTGRSMSVEEMEQEHAALPSTRNVLVIRVAYVAAPEPAEEAGA